MRARRLPWVLLGVPLFAGCASVPSGPDIAVMPPPGKPFAVFVREDRECRQFALASIGEAPSQAAARNVAAGAAVGAAAGAAVGALASGRHDATASGAATGLVVGSMIGASNAQTAAGSLQRRYDIAYAQCMYAKGNLVPGTRYYAPSYPPPGATYPPPPPPPPPGSR